MLHLEAPSANLQAVDVPGSLRLKSIEVCQYVCRKGSWEREWCCVLGSTAGKKQTDLSSSLCWRVGFA